MEISVRGLLMGASVVITAVLITLGIIQLKNAKGLAGAAAKRVSDTTYELMYNDLLRYDGVQVSGSDVVGIAKRNLSSLRAEEQVMITVKTKNKSYSYTKYDEIANMTEKTGAYYVKPAGVFKGEIVINENNVVTQMIFTEV